jgi:Serine dehydrogenase proteinase
LAVKERQQALKNLEEKRGSRIICYITGDRQPQLETKIGMDVFPFFYDVCSRLGKARKVDLFLYSTGGATMAAWGLVNLLREFFDKFSVLIPFKAYSSATLLSLGADEIVMGRAGQLSPVDPTITSPFNPTISVGDNAPPQFLPVSVEDVLGFLDLVRKEAKVESETNLTEIVKILASDVRPLALGSVYRAKEQIKMLARKLLQFHMQGETELAKIEGIVTALTRELYSHDYLITRKEAKSLLGLKIAPCSDDLESAMMVLFQQYAEDLELRTAYSPEGALGNQGTKVITLDRAFIESTDKSFVFRTKREIKKTQVRKEGIPIELFQERALEEGWTDIGVK